MRLGLVLQDRNMYVMLTDVVWHYMSGGTPVIFLMRSKKISQKKFSTALLSFLCLTTANVRNRITALNQIALLPYDGYCFLHSPSLEHFPVWLLLFIAVIIYERKRWNLIFSTLRCLLLLQHTYGWTLLCESSFSFYDTAKNKCGRGHICIYNALSNKADDNIMMTMTWWQYWAEKSKLFPLLTLSSSIPFLSFSLTQPFPIPSSAVYNTPNVVVNANNGWSAT